MAASVRQKGSDRVRRTDRQAIAEIAGSDTKFTALKDLARRHLPDPASLDSQLAKLDDPAAVKGARSVLERKVRLLFGMMKSVPDRARLMRDEKLVSRWFYHFRLSSGSGLGWPAAGLAVLLGLMGMWQPDIAALEPAYYAWRAAKANTSAADQFRAREHLTALVSEEKRGAATAKRLGLLRRDPGLPMDRVDLILRALVEPGAAGGHTPDIAGAMFAALHAGNIDTRRRVHDALQAMASACKIEILADLKAWKPTESDSDAQLEVMAARWRQAWAATTCQSA